MIGATSSSTGGSPGATSWLMLLGAAWPAEYDVDRILVEAGHDGGVLGARYPELGVEPGVAALAAAARRRQPGELLDVAEFGRQVADRLWVVPAPETAEAASVVWGAAPAVTAAMASDPRLWLVDGGRLGPSSPALVMSGASALSLVVSGVSQEELVRVPARVQVLQRAGSPVGVLLVGKAGYDNAELASFFGTGLLWSVPYQSDLPAWVSAVLSGGRSRRSWLWRHAVSLAAEIAERVMATSNEAESDEALP